MTDAPHPVSGTGQAGHAPAPVTREDFERRIREADALIYDCDGTLLKTSDHYAAAWQSAFKNEDLEMDLDWYHGRAGMSEHVLLDAIEAEKGVAVDRPRAVRDLRHFILTHIGSVEEMTLPRLASAAHKRQALVGSKFFLLVPSLSR